LREFYRALGNSRDFNVAQLLKAQAFETPFS